MYVALILYDVKFVKSPINMQQTFFLKCNTNLKCNCSLKWTCRYHVIYMYGIVENAFAIRKNKLSLTDIYYDSFISEIQMPKNPSGPNPRRNVSMNTENHENAK